MYQLAINLPELAISLFITLSATMHASAGGILFVDDDAAAGGDGISWDTAYRFLQDALSDAEEGVISEIHVAQGLYTPDRDEANPDGTGNREATFHLLDGVVLKGGFAGIDAKDPNARDINTNATILSGDLLDNDIFILFLNYEENSFHVVNGSETNDTAMIDGFFIRSGNSDEHGGGFYCENGSPTVMFCGFEFNEATGDGGAMYILSSTLVVTDCNYIFNFANGSPNFPGGGAVKSEQSSISFIRCEFNGNSTTWSGGAIRAFNSTIIIDCMFNSNSSGEFGGAIAQDFGTLEIQGSSFVSNESSEEGGAIIIESAEAIINECDFLTNTANAGRGGGVFLIQSDVTISNSQFEGNITSNSGGGVANESSSLLIYDCDFSFNQAINPSSRGGGLYTRDINTESFVIDCSFYSNSAVLRGGGLYNIDSDLIINCIFTENESQLGGALYNGAGSIPIINCTFFGNTADDGGGLYIGPLTKPEILNCIMWGNDSNSDTDSIFAEGDPSVMYSLVEGGWPEGDGNIDSNPMFVDPENGDYRLLANSPCIDAANSSIVPEDILTDLDGNPRFIEDPNTKDTGQGPCPIVDMGAYEFQDGSPDCCTWDVDGSGSVGTGDLLELFAQWGTPGSADFDGSGAVGTADMLILFANWGPCE